ncbi:hypothetical protein H9651_07310 [Microbacterium sp. Sa4CUA7]|uniref:Flagellar protein FliT n=1 Tax=Microbacterium pullorum TaxID=2762236 RepID=A0ABR8S1U0_9MICO|nr:hypothetical protein [Microbacterium pullorum]MBD7957443.1 hypothetical protein [Microbacterium pullorum]
MSDLATWLDLLERFERDLESTSEASEPWEPVIIDTPLPEHLVDRARLIVARQQQRMARLQVELIATRAHLDAVGLVPARRTDTAAYLDLDG